MNRKAMVVFRSALAMPWHETLAHGMGGELERGGGKLRYADAQKATTRLFRKREKE
jgi:hypothetical protein